MAEEPGPSQTHLPASLMQKPLTRPATVALGCPEPTRLKGLTQLMESENIRLIPCGSPQELVEVLRSRQAGAAVRGLLPAQEVKGELERAYGVQENRDPGSKDGEGGLKLHRAVLVEIDQALRLVGPVGIDEGETLKERAELALGGVRLLADLGAGAMPRGWRPAIGVLSLGRVEDVGRSQDIDASLEAGEALTARLGELGHTVTHYDIRIEAAARDCDMLVTPDGTHGNLIFRTLHYLGGIPAWGAPALGLWPRVTFVDSSRARASFAAPVRLAARLWDIGR